MKTGITALIGSGKEDKECIILKGCFTRILIKACMTVLLYNNPQIWTRQMGTCKQYRHLGLCNPDDSTSISLRKNGL